MKKEDIRPFRFTENYKAEIEEYAVELVKDGADRSVEAKTLIVEAITEQYFLQTNKMPDYLLLEKLSTFILRGQENVNEEYPFLTDRQLRRRHNDKEVVFHSPEERKYHLENDGNKVVKATPSMDSLESHKVSVRLPSDNEDLRRYNGPLRKYFDKNVT